MNNSGEIFRTLFLVIQVIACVIMAVAALLGGFVIGNFENGTFENYKEVIDNITNTCYVVMTIRICSIIVFAISILVFLLTFYCFTKRSMVLSVIIMLLATWTFVMSFSLEPFSTKEKLLDFLAENAFNNGKILNAPSNTLMTMLAVSLVNILLSCFSDRIALHRHRAAVSQYNTYKSPQIGIIYNNTATNYKRCQFCGSEVSGDAEYCEKCGNRLITPTPVETVSPTVQESALIRETDTPAEPPQLEEPQETKPETKICRFCGAEMSASAHFCRNCGKSETEQNNSAEEQTPASTKFCGFCGAEIPADNRFCGMCGKEMPTEKICAKCGAVIPPENNFCGKCGTKYGSDL